MKKTLFTIVLLITSIFSFAQQEILQGEITSDRFLTSDKTYLLRGFVYVKNGATIHIQPGTIVYGEKQSKGTLIITRSGKINAQGTIQRPIIFTSSQAPGNRNFGDWGGVMILGSAPTNCLGGECAAEGGVNNAQGDGLYGGTNAQDSSGVFSFCRIEFAGIPFQADNEVNGLTMCGVGNKTKIDHVQVSFCGDDAFEWFGGTVNCSHLVSYVTWDDDFDTDFGYTGNVQFGLGVRSRNIADISLSNGFESDNSKFGDGFTPFTAPVFSNFTLIGPLATTSTIANPNHYAGMQLTRNTKLSAYNSIIMGFPIGILIDGESCQNNANDGSIGFKNNVVAGCIEQKKVISYAGSPILNIASWFTNNSNTEYAQSTEVQLENPFNVALPNAMPKAGSPVLSGASFSASELNNPFFQNVNFRGAFGTEDWTAGWCNWDPQNAVYIPVSAKFEDFISEFFIYPNPSSNVFKLNFKSNTNTNSQINIYDFSGKMVFSQDIKSSANMLQAIDIDTKNFNKGIHILVLESNSFRKTQKIIIQ